MLEMGENRGLENSYGCKAFEIIAFEMILEL